MRIVPALWLPLALCLPTTANANGRHGGLSCPQRQGRVTSKAIRAFDATSSLSIGDCKVRKVLHLSLHFRPTRLPRLAAAPLAALGLVN
jgi:hypothetical protein